MTDNLREALERIASRCEDWLRINADVASLVVNKSNSVIHTRRGKKAVLAGTIRNCLIDARAALAEAQPALKCPNPDCKNGRVPDKRDAAGVVTWKDCPTCHGEKP